MIATMQDISQRPTPFRYRCWSHNWSFDLPENYGVEVLTHADHRERVGEEAWAAQMFADRRTA